MSYSEFRVRVGLSLGCVIVGFGLGLDYRLGEL